jgi:hypothetical protein
LINKALEVGLNSKSRLVRSLLASTCLTAACGVTATAGTITEGTPPAPADFGSTFGTATLLPVGTTQVFGFLGPLGEGGDPNDWFEFQGLAPGTSFSIIGNNTTHNEASFQFSVFNSSDSLLTGPTAMEFGGDPAGGTVPSNGILVVNTHEYEHFDGPTVGEYEVTLTAETSSTPEPGTIATVGLGAAALLAWRRKRV